MRVIFLNWFVGPAVPRHFVCEYYRGRIPAIHMHDFPENNSCRHLEFHRISSFSSCLSLVSQCPRGYVGNLQVKHPVLVRKCAGRRRG